ncbi:coproporphyrinogen III oxidase, anaerobic [Clostridium cavendishii DSM 21758]|uniref:Coproporphyrinogen III oxidase, anaerobic n=1 Tax=Clostridium cavendishii DSM 21758 TaxID=1121302 RepID=A0A1M6AA79_9CLOT|nr:coproporphyrinogen III oxidase [Clostridium cavendishii]SHI33359.1 coproporphyrinogen III oxidase, anaerobic [Clostridium cavendishii DSM 21758]
MDININLNDMVYRYDVYHMFNIFFTFDNINFVDQNFDYEVIIEENEFSLFYGEKKYYKYFLDKVEIREEIKKFIFLCLRNITGENHPWGTLIGIRPSKKALELIKQEVEEKEIVESFQKNNLVSKSKAELCIEVAKYEEKFVNRKSDNISVYIGMPFCPTRCLYCSFSSTPIASAKKLVQPYLEALNMEIRAMKRYIEKRGLNIETVYFGGGTPTAVTEEEFEMLMEEVYNSFVKDRNVKEFTVECGRPDSITEAKLNTMRTYNVSRISINPQTMNNKSLKAIGRAHLVEDVIEKFNLARRLGFNNINMDIIVGLPNEGLEEVNNTCTIIKDMKPDSLTVHGMSIKRGSRLHEEILLKKTKYIPKQQELNSMYEETKILAKDLGMHPYYMYRQKNMVGTMENVGYSTENNECIYNIEMIEEKQTIIALGAHAVSKVVFLEDNRIERFGNVRDIIEYTKRIDEMISEKIKLLDTLYGV